MKSNPSFTTSPGLVRAAVLAVALAACLPASAQIVQEFHTGEFSSDSLFNGNPIGSDTAFSYASAFDISTGITVGPGATLFPLTSLSLTLQGLGSYTVDPSGVYQLLFSGGGPGGGLATGLVSFGGPGGFVGFFDAFQNVSYTGNRADLVDYIGSDLGPGLPLSLGGGNSFEFVGFGAGHLPTSYLLGVPEPGEYAAMAGAGLVLFGAFRAVRRSRDA